MRSRWMIAMVSGVLVVWWAGGPAMTRAASPDPARSTRAASAPQPAALHAAAAGHAALVGKGYLVPVHRVVVCPATGGVVVKLMVEEGQRVQRGEVLAQLDDAQCQAELAVAKAQLEIARLRLQELQAGTRPEELELAKADVKDALEQSEQSKAGLELAKKLRAFNTMSERSKIFELEAENAARAAKNRVKRLETVLQMLSKGPRAETLAVARAELQRAEAELAKAQRRLESCTLLAPIAGTVVKKNAEPGSFIHPLGFNVPPSICEIADLTVLEVDVWVLDQNMPRVALGQRCAVRVDAFPDRRYEGLVSRVMPTADRATRSLSVRVRVQVPAEEAGVYLRPEMGAVVTFQQPSADKPQ